MKIIQTKTQFEAVKILFKALKVGRQGHIKKLKNGKYQVIIYARGQK